KGLKHRAVHLLIFNGTGELFLQKRTMSKDVSPGCWDSSCCGHVDSGESYDEALWRELKEELGLKLSPAERKKVQMLFKIPACDQTGQEYVHLYLMEHDGPFDLNAKEIESGKWFTLGQ